MKMILECIESVKKNKKIYFKNKGKIKKSQGITLVVLVVTIVVLLILAGISIGILTKSGLLEKTTKSEQKNNESQFLEEINLAIYEAQIEKSGKATLRDLVEVLNKDEKNSYVVKTTKTIASLDKSGIQDVAEINEETKEIYVSSLKYDVEVKVTKELNASVVGLIQKEDNNTENGNSDNLIGDKVKQNITISNLTGETFTINVNSVDANNARILYYYVDDKLVYQGTENSFKVEGLKDNTKYKVIVLADKNDMEVVTKYGDVIRSWLACIGNTDDLTIEEIIGNTNLLSDLLASDTANEYLMKSNEKILPKLLEESFKSSNIFSIIIESKAFSLLLENDNFRNMMYDNASMTEKELAKSTTAIKTLKESSRTKVLTKQFNSGSFGSGKYFIFGYSQNNFSNSTNWDKLSGFSLSPTTISVNWAQSVDTELTGEKHVINRFASNCNFTPHCGMSAKAAIKVFEI